MGKKTNDKERLKTEKRIKKENSRARKIARFRPVKNFLWWLTGVITPIVLIVIAIAVGTFLIPISTYIKWAGGTNTSDYVSADIGNNTIFNGLQNINEYTMEDIPAMKMLIDILSDELSGLEINGSAVIKVDKEKLENLKSYKIVGDFRGFFSQYTSCLSVVATMGGLGVDLGDIGQLSTVNSFEEVTEDQNLTAYFTEGTPLEVPQLYYYDANQLLPEEEGGVVLQSEGEGNGEGEPETETAPTGNFQRAFKNDSSLVEELANLSSDELREIRFYYPALDSVPMVDFTAVFAPRFKMTTVSSILTVFSGTENQDESIIDKLVGDKTVEGLGAMTSGDIFLVDVIDPPSDEMPEKDDPEYDAKLEAYNKNRDVYNILMDSTGKESYDSITLADLNNVNTDEVVLANIIDAPTSDEPAEMPAEDDPDYEAKMEAYNAYHKNRKLYNILLDASDIPFVSCETYKELKLLHLKNVDVDAVKLTTVLEPPSDEMPEKDDPDYDIKLEAYNKNRDVYNILRDATGKETYDEITLGDLNHVETDNVILAHIIDAPTSDEPAEMPAEDDPEYETKMEAYNAYHKNRKLYNILLDATRDPSLDAPTEEYKCSDYQTLTLKSLDNVDVDAVRLITVIERPSDEKPEIGEENYQEKLDAYNKNRDVFNILSDCTGKEFEEITLKDLNGVSTDSVVLSHIVDAPTSNDSTVTLPTEGQPGEIEYDRQMEAYNAYHKNRKLYDILLDAAHLTEEERSQIKTIDLPSGETITDCESYSLLRVEHLNDVEMDDVKLYHVVDEPSEEMPEKGDPDYDAKLEAYNKNRDVYNILRDCTGKEFEEITLRDLNHVDTDKVILANILEAPTSDVPAELPAEDDPDYEAKMEAYNAYHKNRKLYDVLMDAAKLEHNSCADYWKLRVSHLNDFNVDNIKLITVMKTNSNSIVQSLLDEDIANEGKEGYEPVTLGTIGDRINKLLVKDVYDVECFTTNINEASFSTVPTSEFDTPYYKISSDDEDPVYSTTGDGEKYYTVAYYKTTEIIEEVEYTIYTTTKPETGDATAYYVAKSSSVWLFMLYDADQVDKSTFNQDTGVVDYEGTGIADKYIERNITVKGLKDRISVVSASIMNATVRQICDCGMLSGDYAKINGLTFSDAIRQLNYLLSIGA